MMIRDEPPLFSAQTHVSKKSSQIVLNEQRIETILDSGAVCRPIE